MEIGKSEQLDLIQESIKGKNGSTEEQPKSEYDKAQQEAKLRAAITVALECDTAFKMFSFRIISPALFIEEINEIVKRNIKE